MRPSWAVRSLRWVSGLRGRLIVTFVVVAALGAMATAWAVLQQSTTSLIEANQRYFAEDLVSRVTQAAPSVQYPPDQESLDQLRIAAGENALVLYDGGASGGGASGGGIFASGERSVPTELHEATNAQTGSGGATAARVQTQRVNIDGKPWLVAGTPVMTTTPDGNQHPSGIEVYSAHDLTAVQGQVDELVRGAAATTLPVLPLAVLLALLASRSVLRPVARLHSTAQRLASGDLAARTEPTGVDEMARLTRTVNDMAATLQDSMGSMAQMEEGSRRFAADVSHELRTPLTTLTAAIEVLHDVLSRTDGAGMSDDDARDSVQLALLETQRLVRLVEDIMEIARFDAGTARLRWEATDIAEVIRNCVRTRGWSEDVVLPPMTASAPGASMVMADRRRIDVIMANLLGNALEHGGAPVRVLVTTGDEGVTVEVIDSGPGVPEDVLPHVFSRFYKADASRTRTPGSGLGLAIARENTLLHAGTITVANRPEGGAVFTLRLPRAGTGTADGFSDEGERA